MRSETDLQFNAIVANYVKNPRFLRRDWLADEIQKRLNRPDKKFVLLTAEPGMGKSTFMAQLAHDNPAWLRYFIRRDQVSGLSTVGARPFLMRLGFQLEQIHPDSIDTENKNVKSNQAVEQTTQGSKMLGISGKELTVSPFYQQIRLTVSQTVKESGGQMTGIQIGTLIADPLLLPLKDLQEMALFEPARRLAQNGDEQLVILIDALDELRYSRSKDDILEWLTGINPDDLPDNIRFVLSSRPPNDRLERFMRNQKAGLSHLKLDHQEGENKGAFQKQLDADTGEYVEKLLNDARLRLELEQVHYWTEERTAAAWAKTAVCKAEGNLGYMDMIARALDHSIDQGAMERVLDLLNLSNLPDELAGLYTFFLNQIKYATNQEKIQLSDSNGESFTLDVWSAVYQRLLGVMTVAFESLTEAQWHTLSKVQASIEVTHRAIGELKPFLDFDAENGRCRFYHSTLPEFLEDAKLKQSQDTAGFYVDPEKWHQRIGRYYQQFSGSWSECDIYGFRHLPRHLAAGHQAQEIHPILIDFDWLQGKLIKTNILELLDDYDYLETLPKTKIFDGSTAKTPDEPVFLVQQALRLSAHVLAGDAQQLASQLIGRLQGFAEPELQKLVEDAVPGQSGSWLRPLHTTLTPPGNALLRTLTGHTAAVNDMAAIPDGTGRYIISASDDKTLKVWDLHDDVEARKTLRGHKDKVTAVAVTPDGKQAVSFSDDKTIKVWNLDDESETESASYDIETPLTKPMAVTCEGQLVGTTYDDEGSQFVRMWQLPGDFEPCENQTNAKEDGFAKRFARGVSSIAILSFNILILFYILASWFFGELIAELDILGIVFIIVFFIVACMRALFSEPNDIKVVDLPIEPQPADSNNSTESSNKKMNRSRKKVGGETAKRVKAVMFRFFGTTTIIFGIIEVSQIGSVSQEDTEFNLSFLAVILFFILLSSYAVKVLYSDETVDSIAIWLKEKRVMAVARNHTIKVRNLHNRNWRMILYGRLTFKVSTRLKPISAMAITADGNYMIYASDNSLAARRLKSDLRNRITSRVYLKQFSKNEGPISALVTLSDNEHVVSASQNALKLWNLKKGVWVARIGGIRQVTTLLVAPNDPWIISAANDGTLKVWDTSDVIRDTKGENHTDSNQIQGLSMAADGSQVISISISDHDQSQRSHHHTVRIWDKSDVIKDSTASLEFDMGRLDRMAIAPDGKQAVSVRGKHLMLWDLQDGKKMNKVRLHHPTRWKRLPKLVNVLVNKSTIALVVTYFIEFIKLFFSDLLFITFIIAAGATVYSSRGQFLGPYGRMLDKLNQRHAARNDRSKNLWRSGVNEGRAIREQLRAIISVRVGDFAVTPNGRFAVSALYKDVIVTNLEEKHQKVLRGHTDEITAVSVTPDGQHIVSAAQDNTVRVWHINQDDSRSSVLTVSCAVTALAIAADGQQVVFATKDHKLYAWRSVDDTATELAEKEGEITAVTLIHADQAVIVACRDRTVEVINLTTKRCEATYMGDAIPLHLSFTLNKNTVAVGDENGRFHLLQLEGMEIQTGQKVNYEYAQ